jgi:hypothetical protein
LLDLHIEEFAIDFGVFVAFHVESVGEALNPELSVVAFFSAADRL